MIWYFFKSVLLVPCLYGYATFSVLKHKKYSCFTWVPTPPRAEKPLLNKNIVMCNNICISGRPASNVTWTAYKLCYKVHKY